MYGTVPEEGGRVPLAWFAIPENPIRGDVLSLKVMSYVTLYASSRLSPVSSPISTGGSSD